MNIIPAQQSRKGTSSFLNDNQHQGIKRKMHSQQAGNSKRSLWPRSDEMCPKIDLPIFVLSAEVITARDDERQLTLAKAKSRFNNAEGYLNLMQIKVMISEWRSQEIDTAVEELKELYKKLRRAKSKYEVFCSSNEMREWKVEIKTNDANCTRFEVIAEREIAYCYADTIGQEVGIIAEICKIQDQIKIEKTGYDFLIKEYEELLLDLIALNAEPIPQNSESKDMKVLIAKVERQIMAAKCSVEFAHSRL